MGGLRKRLNSGLGAQVAGIFAAGAVVQGVRNSIAFSKSLDDLAIASQGAVGEIGEFRKQVLSVSSDTGVAKEEILSGAAAFVELTGDGKEAARQMELFAKITKATGARMGDVSKSSAAMNQNLGITGDQMERAFSILIAQGKAGAIELRDVAGELAGLAPKAARFAGGSGVGGLAKLGAALQVARQGFGSAAETATALDSLMGAIVKNSSKLKKEGINIFNKDGTLREFDEIVNAIEAKGFRSDKLIKLFGRKEAEAAFIQLTKNRGAWAKLTAETMKANDVAEDYAKRQQTDSAKIEKAINKVKNAWETLFGWIVKAAGFFLDEDRWVEAIEFWVETWNDAINTIKAGLQSLLNKIEEVDPFGTGGFGEAVGELAMPDDAAPLLQGSREDIIRRSGLVRPKADKTIAPQVNVSVTAPAGSDPRAMGDVISRAVKEVLNVEIRRAAEATK